jgi:hypothetical protein
LKGEKNVKTMKFVLAMACVLGLAASCFAQSADTNAVTNRMSGMQAAKARVQALKAAQAKVHEQSSAETPVAAGLVSGTLTFTVTISLHPGFPSTSKIYCYIDASTNEYSAEPTGSFDANAYVTATISGSTATCTTSIKYGWWLASPSTDSLDEYVDIYTIYGTYGTAPYWENTSDWTNSVTGVPASGSTTSVKVSTAL